MMIPALSLPLRLLGALALEDEAAGDGCSVTAGEMFWRPLTLMDC